MSFVQLPCDQWEIGQVVNDEQSIAESALLFLQELLLVFRSFCEDKYLVSSV